MLVRAAARPNVNGTKTLETWIVFENLDYTKMDLKNIYATVRNIVITYSLFS